MSSSQSSSTSSVSSESSSSSSSLSQSSSSSQSQYTTRTVDLFAINDFHGAIQPSGYEMGAVKNFSYLKQKAQTENTVVLGSGDFFQGSIESNYNRGALVTELMIEAGFTAYTLGNHDFDWGSTYINQNRNLAPKVSNETDNVPFLGANIFNYNIETKTVGTHADDLCESYATKTLENGLKIGIIGTIGSDQITSIASEYADPYTFLDPATYVKQYSNELRANGCDVIVWDNHAGSNDSLTSSYNYDLTQTSSVSGKRYVDAVFCSHTHNHEKAMVNGVPIIQGQNNGRGLGEISLIIDKNGNISCSKYSYYYDNVYASNFMASTTADNTIQEVVDYYAVETTPLANKVIGTSNGVFTKKNSSGEASVSNLMVAAAADYINKSDDLKNLGITAVIANQGRADIYEGDITYSDLFKAVPFDNNYLILNVIGSDIINEAQISNNSTYLMDVNQKYYYSSYYKIAVLDYLGTHRDSDREYDYFSSLSYGGEVLGQINAQGGMSPMNVVNDFNYREIASSYMENTLNKQIDVLDFVYNTGHFCVDYIQV